MTEPGTNPTPTPTPTAADGTYSIEVETGAAMFKVVDCKLTVKNGLMSAVITLSGTGMIIFIWEREQMLRKQIVNHGFHMW